MCVRSGYKTLGPSILPIALVPLGHIVGSQLLLLLNNKSLVAEMATMSIVTAVDVAALVSAAAVIIVCSKSFFKKKSTRRSYCLVMIGFMAILTLVLLINFYGEI
jgi:hypothetical protein